MSRKRLTIGIILILLGLYFIYWYIEPKTPLTALEKQYTAKEETILRYVGLIRQIHINSEKSLLFYFNGNRNVNCAVAEKKFGRYKIVDVSAELPTNQQELRAGLFYSTYARGNKWYYFGIIYDDSVKKVVWSDIEATNFSSLNMNMFYADGNLKFTDDGYHLYDSNGNELEHQKLVKYIKLN